MSELAAVQASIEQWSVKLVRERKRTYVARKCNTAESVHPLLSWMKDLAEEQFVAIYLNSKLEPIGLQVVSHGSLNSSIVHPREVFKGALLANAYALIVAHNHPSGNTTPSTQDDNCTKDLIKAGEMMGISVMDHIIVGDNYYHYREARGHWF